MADQHKIEQYLASILATKDIFLVGVKVDQNNRIVVHIDTADGISIEECARVSRELEDWLDREQEDFALEVSSPGLDAPFRVVDQYRKNVGRDIIVVRADGERLAGNLKETGENGIVLEVSRKKKGKPPSTTLHELSFSEIKSARVSLTF
jgi:ribosome maturation factor RimP